MTLGRVGNAGSEQPVVADSDGTFSIRPITEEIDGAFLERDGIEQVRAALERGALDPVEVTNARFGSPVVPPGLLVCVGLNYRQHAIETGGEIPTEPVLFMKSPRCVIGPNDDVLIPRGSTSTDWEVELAIVIGRRAHYLESQSTRHGRASQGSRSRTTSARLATSSPRQHPQALPSVCPGQPYLREGDVTRLQINELGDQRQ
jgi:2-keto-4-pentenoate hydratase/2-oxohepta-3-ene-1,7-dioic acid hydratase in catechol pathway